MAEVNDQDIYRYLLGRKNPNIKQFQSTAGAAPVAKDVKAIAIPDDKRGRMPLTQERFVIRESPARVEWEREVRKALKTLKGQNGHRVTAPMIYEWTTGMSVQDVINVEGADPKTSGSANSHLRHINWVLSQYFGKPYKTTIAGRPVGRAYIVPRGFRIELKPPVNLTLWPEWEAGTLKP